MHILVTNDDGPPSTQASPYVLDFVRTLQDNGHTVSVCLPHTQRSWIGKAHIVGQAIKPSYYLPPPRSKQDAQVDCDTGKTSKRPQSPGSKQEEWILVDSTPASCIQIGLYHYFQERGPIDLVVSGPNFGRNTTAVFALSSGTIGGAMEAAVCGKKSIALSYAYFQPNGLKNNPETIAAASRTAVRVIENQYKKWDKNVGLYSINVPVVKGVEKAKVYYTNILNNRWANSCFKVMDVSEEDDRDADEQEAEIRKEEGNAEAGDRQTRSKRKADTQSRSISHSRYKHKQFRWQPSLTDVIQSVEHSNEKEGDKFNDGWIISQEFVSVTPMVANFAMLPGTVTGEVKL